MLPTYVQFRAFYAKYWGESSTTKFKFIKMSNSGASAWIERHGEIECVPETVLFFECPECNRRRYFTDHDCLPVVKTMPCILPQVAILFTGDPYDTY